MKKEKSKDTIVAPISSAVGSSVAMLRISGSQAIAIANKFFPLRDLQRALGGRFFFGPLNDDKKDLIDEVVLLVYKAPHSFSGEDAVEISFHANPLILEKALHTFVNAGCRLAEPGEFSKRAFINGKIDLVQAEAIADLIAAKSQAAIKTSLFQVSGKFSGRINNIKQNLTDIAALIELDLDFSGEDLEIVTADNILDKLNNLIGEIDRLLISYKAGKVLKEGIKVLITGKPNVGKSSLMNALLEKKRAIVSSTPGTTRDIIHDEVFVDNVLVRFIDSAGIHLTDNSVEAEGIERSREYFDIAGLIILVVDISRELTKDDINLLESSIQFFKDKLIVAGNKSDLQINQTTVEYLIKCQTPLYKVSAKTGMNIGQLKKDIASRIKGGAGLFAEDVFITNQRQFDMLGRTKQSLERAVAGIKQAFGFEFIAVDVRDAIGQLSGITGEIATEDVLNTIFSNFCIGK